MNHQIQRRSFLKYSGLLGLGLLAARYPVWAKSVLSDGYPEHNIPLEKGIDTEWLKSIYERGQQTVCLKSRNELRYIGMPIGGLHDTCPV